MGTEDRVGKQIEQYQDLAKQHKGIDTAALMINALTQARQEEIDQRKKRTAYIVSVALPPFGLFYAAYYAFGGKPDGKRVAITCVILTALSALLAWGIGALILGSLGPDTTSQIQSINAADLQKLLQQ